MDRPTRWRAVTLLLILSACTAGAVLVPASGPVEGCPRLVARPRASVPPPTKPLPAIAWRPATDSNELVWVDPITLEERGPGLDLGGQDLGWLRASSPDGKFAAIGGSSSTIRIVDLARNRVSAEFRVDNHPSALLEWPDQDAIVAVTQPLDNTGGSIVMVDPENGDVIADKELSGQVIEATASPGVAAALTSPPVPEGSRRRSELSVLFISGDAFTIPLDRIESGYRSPPESSRDPFGSTTSPGLTINEDGSRVIIVGIDGFVADVSLTDRSVTYAHLAGPAPSILTSWLISPAEAKLISYKDVSARWLANGVVAIYGYRQMLELTGRHRVQEHLSSSGLTIFDRNEHRACILEQRADTLLEADGVLLVFREFGDGPRAGMGLSAYTVDGRKMWHNFGDRVLDRVGVVGGYAYVTDSWDGWVTSVVDLASGEIVSRVRGRPPHVLTIDSNM